MMQIQIDGEKAIEEIESILGDAKKKKAPQILSKSVNAVAAEARTLLAKQAQETYAIKSVGFNKAMTVKKGTARTPVAVIKASGAPTELFKFKTSPAVYKTGKQKAKKTRARVKAHGGMKNILMDGRWAFVTQFASGHKTLVQRTTEKRLPIKTLYSLSIPQMIGNENEVYGFVQPQIQEMLWAHIYQECDKELLRGVK